MKISRWDQYPLDVTLKDQDWIVVDLTWATVRFTVRKSATINDTDDTTAVISKIINSFSSPTLWVFTINFVESDTATLDIWDYYFDVQAELSSGDIISTPIGIFTVEQDVTKNVN